MSCIFVEYFREVDRMMGSVHKISNSLSPTLPRGFLPTVGNSCHDTQDFGRRHNFQDVIFSEGINLHEAKLLHLCRQNGLNQNLTSERNIDKCAETSSDYMRNLESEIFQEKSCPKKRS